MDDANPAFMAYREIKRRIVELIDHSDPGAEVEPDKGAVA